MGSPPSGLVETPLAEWVRWRNIFAAAIELFENLMDKHVEDIDTRLQTAQPGSLRWYYEKVLAFQLGDSLQITDDGILYYPQIDEDKQIIARAAVSEDIINPTFQIPGLIVKVAKKGDTGELEPLTALEKSQVDFYIEEIKIAGVQHVLISDEADLLKNTITVYFRKNYNIDDVIISVKEALKGYRDELNFNGVISLSDEYRILDSLAEVANVEISVFEWKKYTDPSYTAVLVQQLYAGYFNYDVGGGNFQVDFIPEGGDTVYQSITDLS